VAVTPPVYPARRATWRDERCSLLSLRRTGEGIEQAAFVVRQVARGSTEE
jgi:hypothetical protein